MGSNGLVGTEDFALISAEGFLDWLEPGRFADLIDGEIELHSPVSIAHARLLNFVDRLMGAYVDRHNLGELFREVVAVKLSSRNVFMPDLAFYRKDRGDVFQENHAAGAPDLVVEVLSPRTAERHLGVKFAEYEQHGVAEYWILDPERGAHRFYGREGELFEQYAGQGVESSPEKPHSRTVDGFFLKLAWLNPQNLPAIDEALAEIEGSRRR